MTGIDNDIVGERHDFAPQAVKQSASQHLLGHVCRFLSKVGAAYISQEKGVPCEYGVRLALLITEQIGGGLHGVSRGVDDLEGHLSDLEHLTVLSDVRTKLRVCVRAENNGCSRLF